MSRLLPGRATAKGTARFSERFASGFSADFFRTLDETVRVSSLGLGTYLGECNDADDERYEETTRAAVHRGVNLIDTAINYRCQRSERTIGHALRAVVGSGAVSRDELVVCTKGGYVPLDETPPTTREAYQEYLEKEYFGQGILSLKEIVAGGHSLAPTYLADQIRRSRTNLGVQTIDLYYLHNPEQQLDVIKPAALLDRLRDAFALLESRCEAGEIARYGCATWNGFRAAPGSRGHLNLADIVAVAREVGGEMNRFRVVQLPINLAMPEAMRQPTQRLGRRTVPFLEAAAELGVSVVASASLLQSKLTTGLPVELREAIPGMTTDAQRAIAFVRSLPVASALVGMKSHGHLEENLESARTEIG